MKTPGHPASDSRGILVFSDDWGRHPSSCQHLIRHLLDRTPVVWVNTIGTRRPRFSPYTLQRGLGKVRHWVGSGEATGDEKARPTPQWQAP